MTFIKTESSHHNRVEEPASGPYPDACFLHLGSVQLGGRGKFLGAPQEGGPASCGRRAGGPSARARAALGRLATPHALIQEAFMEQLSRARTCGRQDTEQIARVAFWSCWHSQFGGETDVRPG